jgi:acetyltransferase-like isoleucine patch superfamily enzyme
MIRSKWRYALFLLVGPYRILWRPISSGLLILRAWVEELIWGMEPVTELVARARGRQLPALLRACGARIGPAVDLRHPMIIHNPQNRLRDLNIGEQTHIGKDCLLDLTAPITIGKSVTLAMRVTIITHFDTYYSPLRLGPYPSKKKGVLIEDGAYIGAGAMVLHGAHIGRCAVIAAGAVVLADVPAYTVVAGVPARPIKQIDPHTIPGERTK